GKLQIESTRKNAGKIAATPCEEVVRGGEPTARQTDHADAMGKAKAIEITAKDNSAQQMIWVYDGDQPFVCTCVTLRNSTNAAQTFTKLSPISCAIETTSPIADLRLFGSDGLSPAEKGKTSYVFLALVEPKSRAGVVSRW